MFFRKKKQPILSAEHIEKENKRADEQVGAAKEELSVAKTAADDVRKIRLENNFMADFRATLRGSNG